MFNFTTTTVINTNQDYTTGLALWSTQDATDDKPASLNVKRHLKFIKDNVLSITKAEYSAPQMPVATLDFAHLTAPTATTTFRIAMYIKLSNSANSYYANDLVYKGKPLYIEFVWKQGETAAAVAAKIKDIAKKYMLLVYEKDLVKISIDGTTTSKVIITGTDECQRFERVDIEKFVEGDVPAFGKFEVVKSAMTEAHKTDSDYDANFTIVQGKEGFGTYQWILKNLRLPTAAKTSWTSVTADEAPILGAKYNEYVVRYCVNRGVMGGDAVGEVTKSLTTHVFFVNQAISSEFETALKKIAPEGTLIDVPKKATSGENTDQHGS